MAGIEDFLAFYAQQSAENRCFLLHGSPRLPEANARQLQSRPLQEPPHVPMLHDTTGPAVSSKNVLFRRRSDGCLCDVLHTKRLLITSLQSFKDTLHVPQK